MANSKYSLSLDSARDFYYEKKYIQCISVCNFLLKTAPDDPEIYFILAASLNAISDNKFALNNINIAISYKRSAAYLNMRGKIFIDMGYNTEAIDDLRACLKLHPHFPEALTNLSIAYKCVGQEKKSLLAAREATELAPGLIEAWINLGSVYHALKDNINALMSYKRAHEIEPKNKLVTASLAKIYYEQCDFDSALTLFSALKDEDFNSLDLAFPHAHILKQRNDMLSASEVLLSSLSEHKNPNDLRSYLYQDVFFALLVEIFSFNAETLGRRDFVADAYRSLIDYVPNIAHAIWVNIGKIRFDQQKIDDAINACLNSINSTPSSSLSKMWAYTNMGVCYITTGHSVDAINAFNEALKINPEFIPALGWLLKEKGHICDWKDYNNLVAKFKVLVGSDLAQPIAPFTALSVFEKPNELLFWAKLSAQRMFQNVANNSALKKDNNTYSKSKKIRIGYYSYDFRNHPVAHLIARVLELHDREKFEIFAYSYGPNDGSDVRKRIESTVSSFVDLESFSVLDTAKRIIDDHIDFLIDLTGHTLHNRSEVFALRPARIQAHWLGFIGTMGTSFFDYIIADEVVIPQGDEQYFTEHILRLPSGFHATDDTKIAYRTYLKRRDFGLPDSGFVFGCFCQTLKIQPKMFDNWVRILKAVPGSVLWIASGPSGAIENLKEEAKTKGINPERLIVANRCTVDEYLHRFLLIDLCLDTFPYTSGTVASDSLKAACPILTLSGDTMVSRMAGSILIQAGMPELIARSHDEYVSMAIDLATKQDFYLPLKQRLLHYCNSGKLFDTKKIVKELEDCVETVVG